MLPHRANQPDFVSQIQPGPADSVLAEITG
jgi:hypothetical protein